MSEKNIGGVCQPLEIHFWGGRVDVGNTLAKYSQIWNVNGEVLFFLYVLMATF